MALRQALFTYLPLGISIEKLQAFAKEQALTYSGQVVTDLFPRQITEANVTFDYRVLCTAQAPEERWPWSWFSLSNGWVWLMYFYFRDDCLVDIQVTLMGNGL